MNLDNQMDHIQYQIFGITLTIFLRSINVDDDRSIRIYVNKIENRVKFKIKMDIILKF